MEKQRKTDAELAEPYFQHPQPQKSQPATGQIASDTVPTGEQLQDLTNRVQILENTSHGRVVFNTGLIGLFESLTAAPTGLPLSPYDQVKIAKISGTTYLYIYDYNQKTGGSASNGWFRVAIT